MPDAQPPSMNRTLLIASLFTGASLTACATAPRQQLTNAEATVRAAEAVGAKDEPRASYHLKLAKDQIEVAKPLVEGSNKDRKTAAKVLDRAAADAELALSLAESTELQNEADKTWNEVRELQASR